MDPLQVSVLHVAGDVTAHTFDRTVQVLAQIGLHQVVVPLRPVAPGRAVGAIELRPVPRAASSLARARALEDELAGLAEERSFYAVHLHGPTACVLGSRALRGAAVAARMPASTRLLLSPHVTHLSGWKSVLVGRLLRTQLAPLQRGVLLAAPGEAHVVSRMLERSAEILAPAVEPVFFDAPRQHDAPALVLAGGNELQAVDGVTRLAVLLNSRDQRVPVAWLGAVSRPGEAQLQAAGMQVIEVEDPAAAARALAGARAYLHLSQTAGDLPLLARAMAAGVPCLASDTPTHRAVLRHGDSGFICAGPLDFLEKLIVLLRDAVERERMGQAGRAEAARLFTQRHFEGAVLRAYGFHRVTLLPKKALTVA